MAQINELNRRCDYVHIQGKDTIIAEMKIEHNDQLLFLTATWNSEHSKSVKYETLPKSIYDLVTFAEINPQKLEQIRNEAQYSSENEDETFAGTYGKQYKKLTQMIMDKILEEDLFKGNMQAVEDLNWTADFLPKEKLIPFHLVLVYHQDRLISDLGNGKKQYDVAVKMENSAFPEGNVYLTASGLENTSYFVTKLPLIDAIREAETPEDNSLKEQAYLNARASVEPLRIFTEKKSAQRSRYREYFAYLDNQLKKLYEKGEDALPRT